MGEQLLNMLKNSRFTNVIASLALVISLITAGLVISDAYVGRTSVLATILQSVGLCPAVDSSKGVSGNPDSAAPKPAPTQTVTQTPSVEPSVSQSPSDEPVPNLTSDPSESPVKGVAGTAGAPGNSGPSGADGALGAPGVPGETGPAGPAGPSGPQGICAYANLLAVPGNLIPESDNAFSLGTAEKRWKDLHVGPGTIYIQETTNPLNQVAISVQAGSLKFDGAQALKVGNIRLSPTGITSETPNAPITLGDNLFNSFIQLQSAGLKFKDGTIQSTAATGVVGPAGPPGPTGPQGPRGRDGSIEGFIEVPVCIIEDSPVYPKFTMVYSKCGEIEGKGRDIVILERKE